MFLLERIITPILSAIIFSTIIGAGSYWSSFLIISTFVYLIGGNLVSYMIDVYILEKLSIHLSIKYILSILLYSLGGIVIVLLAGVSQGVVLFEIEPLMALGTMPALIYLHVKLGLNLFAIMLDRKKSA